MKVVNNKGESVTARKVFDKFYAITCGESGRGRKLGFIPLCKELQEAIEENDSFTIPEVSIINTKKGNLLAIPGYTDKDLMVVTDWYGGYRGGIKSNVNKLIEEGCLEVLACGATAEGMAGRMGGEQQYIFKVLKSCEIEYRKLGRVYGNPTDWIIGIDLECRRVEEYSKDEDVCLEY